MKHLLTFVLLCWATVLAGCWHLPKPTPPIDNENPPVDTGAVDTGAALTGNIYYSSGAELVTVTSPLPGQAVTSPLIIEGTAPGYRFFEATAPVILANRDGLIIAQGHITASWERMTENIIPFNGVLTYTVDPNRANDNGALILQKSNASGLPEHDAAVEMTLHLR